MERTYALEEIQAIVYPILRSHGVSRAYLFGSYARGEERKDSDLDLYVVTSDDAEGRSGPYITI